MLAILLLIACVHGEQIWGPALEGGRDGELLQVHIVFRHGHKEPKHFYPNDPHADAPIWKDGANQLTILGKQQGFRFGQNLRSRYRRLLPDERAWKAVTAVSSDTIRTLMTSAVVLAGMIPPGEEDAWSNITWQPAAIHSSPVNIDNLLASHPHCERYDQLVKQIPNENDDETRMLYQLLTRYTGEKISSPVALLNLYTCLQIEEQAGLELPKWTQAVYEKLERHAAKALLRTSQTLELKRLRSGPLIEKLTGHKTFSSSYNIHLYGTHDTVLGGLLGSLSFNLTKPSSFTSAFIVEYRESNGEVHAQFWYRTGPDDELSRLELAGCGIRCPWNELNKIVEPLIPKDWILECKILEYTRRITIELCYVFVAIIFIVLSGWWFMTKYGSETYETIV